MTGPWTSRAIACTASKSPGEAIGKPASITSTPSRASWCAISSFSVAFSEMPGDCSPSRSVVSKMMTRLSSMSRAPSRLVTCSFVLGLRLRGRHALFPPKGEEKEEGKAAERHRARQRYLTGRARTRRRVLEPALDAPAVGRRGPAAAASPPSAGSGRARELRAGAITSDAAGGGRP